VKSVKTVASSGFIISRAVHYIVDSDQFLLNVRQWWFKLCYCCFQPVLLPADCHCCCCCVRRQLMRLTDLYSSTEVHDHILPIAFFLVDDRVYQVRITALRVVRHNVHFVTRSLCISNCYWYVHTDMHSYSTWECFCWYLYLFSWYCAEIRCWMDHVDWPDEICSDYWRYALSEPYKEHPVYYCNNFIYCQPTYTFWHIYSIGNLQLDDMCICHSSMALSVTHCGSVDHTVHASTSHCISSITSLIGDYYMCSCIRPDLVNNSVQTWNVGRLQTWVS